MNRCVRKWLVRVARWEKNPYDQAERLFQAYDPKRVERRMLGTEP